MNAIQTQNGKELSNSSARSSTTGLFSAEKKHKKSNQIFIKEIYLVRECIYKGNFHNTYKGINKISRQPLMIKMCNQFHEHMNNENKIFKLLKEANSIPRVLFIGEEKINGSNYFVRVTESYGPSIKILHTLMGNQFQLSTICVFAIQMLSVIEEIHKSNVVHRNIKPRKIVIHNDLKNLQLFLLDLKYGRKYKHKNGQLVRYTENNRILNKSFCNKFSSVGTHLGISPSRKDDMESLGYIFIYFFKKGNMFGGRKFKQKEEKLKFYEEWKLSIIPEMLSQEMPSEFIGYLNYVKSMNILDPPEYDTWKKAFKGLLLKLGISTFNFQYEWIPKIQSDLAKSKIGSKSQLKFSETNPLLDQTETENKRKLSFNGIETEERNKSTTNVTSATTTAAALNNASTTFKQQEDGSNRSFQKKKFADSQDFNTTTAGGNEKDSKNNVTPPDNEYFYGPVELDLIDQNFQSINQTSFSFGGDPQFRNSNDNNGEDKAANEFKIINSSPQSPEIKINQNPLLIVTPNFAKYSPSSQCSEDQNDSIFSTEDLNIINDESIQSLSSNLMKQPELLMQQPLIFRHKQL